MLKEKKILAIIPARGGSRGIHGKNLVSLCGQPLIQYTIDASKNSKTISRTILSSDSNEIIEYCKAWGIEVPFKRPRELARDDTLMIDVVKHILQFLKESENYTPDFILILQPTSPLRTAKHIDDAVELLEKTGCDSVVTVVEVPHQYNPMSVMKIVNGRLIPFLEGEGTTRLSRQTKPKVYARNGAAVYAVRYTTIMQYNNFFGKDSRPLIMKHEESVDIDTDFDLQLAESLLKKTK
jgi:CMP-N,N'-diacetyllegionaminic acid synthase